METITQLLDNKVFLKTLFDAIPCAILVLDGDRRVHAANTYFLREYGTFPDTALMNRVGNVMQCVNAFKNDEDAGFQRNAAPVQYEIPR